jgi:PAS domain S-box-containing protein
VTERKQAEEAMRESEEKWRSLTEYSPDYIMLLDRNANILFVNHTLPELSREQVIGTSFYDYALKEYRQTTLECFERVLTTGKPDQFESVYVDENGNPTIFESHVGPVMRAGEVWGLTVRSTDITQRKQAEEALQTLSHELGERVKELDCLYGISKLAGQQDIALEEILQGTVELLPPAFQYPEATCARIILEGQEFRTKDFQETRWRLATDLDTHGERTGALEVYYLEERPGHDEGPFLTEERKLIDAVAERLGRITERRQAQEALGKREKEYRQLLEALQEGIWVIDQDANTTFVNPRMAEMLGYTEDEMLGQHLYSFMDERGIEITERNLERRAQGIQEQHDFEFLRKDGSRIYTLLETSPLYDDDGNYAGGIAGLQDITERKHAEEALRESEARWRSVTENSPDYVMILDADLNIQFANYPSPGLTVEELIGTPLYTLAAEDRQAEIRRILENVLNTAEPGGYETEYKTPDGSTIHYESRVVARTLDDQVIGLAVNARDITERKQAEEALKEAAAAAERNRLARDLHDSVTQALFSASLVAEVLPQVWQRDPEVGQQGLEELRLLTRSALAEMRTMLLELRPTALVETSLNDLLRQLTEAIAGRAQLAVQFDIEPIPTLPPDVHVTFYRVAQEALHNVVKHAGANQVTVDLHISPPVSAQQAGDWRGQAILHISDDGRGIDQSSTQPDQLGLGIMRERAEAIGAMLAVEGRPDRGSQVTLVWTNT